MLEIVGDAVSVHSTFIASLSENPDAVSAAAQVLEKLSARGVAISDRAGALTVIAGSLRRSRDAGKLAADLFDAKEFSAASAVFSDIAEALPKASSAQQKYAMALKHDRQYERSLEVFSDIVENSPASAYTLWNAAVVALLCGRHDIGLKYLTAAEISEPSAPRVMVYSATARALAGEIAGLSSSLNDNLKQKFLELPQWSRNEVAALLDGGKPIEAASPLNRSITLGIALLQSTLGLKGIALSSDTIAIAEANAQPAVLLALVDHLIAQQDFSSVSRIANVLAGRSDLSQEEKIKTHLIAMKYGDAQQVEANALALVNTSHIDQVLDLVEQQIAAGEGAKFFSVLEALSAALPDNVKILQTLGEAYVSRGLHHAAVPCFERLINNGHGSAKLHAEAAFSQWALNRFTDAEAHFTNAIGLTPNTAEYVRARAHVRFDKNDFAGALADFKDLRALAPLDGDDLMRQAVANRALAQHDAALASFIEMQPFAKPGTAAVWNNLVAANCEAFSAGDKRAASNRLFALAGSSDKFEEKLFAAIGLYNAGLLSSAEPVIDGLLQRNRASVIVNLWSLLVRLSWGGSADAAKQVIEGAMPVDAIPELIFLGAIACAGAGEHERADRIAGQLGALHPSYPHLPLLLSRLAAAQQAAADPANPDSRNAVLAALGLTSGEAIVPARITVVVPNCNEARYISDCLNSVLMQSFPFWECIIVDDVSSDTSLDVARSFVRADPRFQIIRHGTNKGLAATRNTGLLHAKGEYITFLDADDYFSQHSLYDRYRQLCLNRGNEAVAGAYCGMRHVPEHTYGEFELTPKALETPIRTLQSSGYESPFNAHAPMLRTSIIRACGGFDESMRFGAEDWDCWIRIMRLGHHFVGTQKIGAAYRQKRHSMVRSLAPQHVEAAREIYSKLARSTDAIAYEGEPVYVYAKPLWYYQCINVFAQRVIRFAAMAYMSGDRAGFDAILERNAIPLDLLKATRMRIGDHVKSGVERFLAGVNNPLRDLNVPQSVAARVEEITALVNEKLLGAPLSGIEWLLQSQPAPASAPAVIRTATQNTAPPADYEKLEERFAFKADTLKLRKFYNKHKGERCFIVGNGPSLNQMDLTKLKNDISIGVNGIFYKTDEMGFAPNYYVVEDSSVMKENIARIIGVKAEAKFFPTIYHDLHPADDNVHFFTMNRGFYEPTSPNYCVPRFSTDVSQRAFCGQSVTYINLQLAFYMGFTKVYLIGMDFSYVIPPEHEKKGDIIKSTTDDPNHFNPNYFGKGKTWKDPKLDRVLQNYQMAKFAYECAGRSIVNATAGGKLELFDRASFDSLF